MRKKILMIYACFILIIGGYVLLSLILESEIACFYRSRYGYECPGCGLSRMIFSLCQLDIPAAFSFNPVGFVALFLLNGVAALCFWNKGKWLQQPRTLYILLGVTVAAFLIQGFIRNVS